MSDTTPQTRPSASAATEPPFTPIKLTGKNRQRDHEPEEGPRGWFLPQIEETYTRLAPHGAAVVPAPSTTPESGVAFASLLQPSEGESVLAQVSATTWLERLAEYKQRKAAVMPAAAAAIGPGAPVVPGARNWLPPWADRGE